MIQNGRNIIHIQDNYSIYYPYLCNGKNDNESFVSFVRFLFNNASTYMNQIRNYNSLDRTST